MQRAGILHGTAAITAGKQDKCRVGCEQRAGVSVRVATFGEMGRPRDYRGRWPYVTTF
jgi:hypothetical protein